MIDEKLAIIKENNQKVFDAGKFKTLNKSKYMHPTVSGSAISVNDVNSMEHNLGVKVASKNLLPYPYYNKTYTNNGIDFTLNEDGTVTANGTATGPANFYLYLDYDNLLPLKDKEITVSGCPTGGDVSTYYIAVSGTAGTYIETGGGKTLTIPRDCHAVYIRVATGATVNNLVFKPQIELGSTATEYTPYVADLNGVEVSRYGKNLFDINNIESGEKGTFNINEDDSITFYFNSTYASYFPFAYWLEVLPNTDYVISIGQGTSVKSIFGYTDMLRGNKLFAKGLTSDKCVTFNSGNNSRILIGIYSQVEYRETTATEETIRNIQIELGTIPTNYEPYKEPQTATANLDEIAEGLTSLSPNMTLLTDTEGVTINCQYYRDIDTYINNLATNIALTGGN